MFLSSTNHGFWFQHKLALLFHFCFVKCEHFFLTCTHFQSTVAKFNKPLQSVETVEFDEATTLQCEVSMPQAQVTWLKDGEPITVGKKYEVVEEGPVRRLIIKTIETEDQADYTCVVGKQKTEAGVFVKGKH